MRTAESPTLETVNFHLMYSTTPPGRSIVWMEQIALLTDCVTRLVKAEEVDIAESQESVSSKQKQHSTVLSIFSLMGL